MNEKVNRKKVLITGGTGSIGQALVRCFCENGADVTFQYFTNVSIAEQLEKECRAKSLLLDFTKDHELPDIEVDVLVNNAGINITNALAHEVSTENWNTTMMVNLTLPFLMIRKYLPSMMARGWGRIINISSIYGLRGTENNLPYNVSKHGLSGLTKTVAKEAAVFGVTCNEICPGPVESELMRRIADENQQTTGQDSEEYLQEISDEIPAERMANPSEIADLALFLSSPEAAYLNGASIPLDGGLIA